MKQVSISAFQAVYFLFILLVWTLLAIIVVFIIQKLIRIVFFKAEIKQSLSKNDKVFLSVKIPSGNTNKEKAMEEFLRSLHRVLPNNTFFSLEMVSSDQFLRFFLVLPKHFKNLIESQLYAQYPEAETEEVEDYVSSLNKNTVIKQLYFRRSSIYPFSTYHNQEEGILKTLSAILSKTEPGEKVYLQIILKRVGSKFWERGFQAFRFYLFGKKQQSEDAPDPMYWKLSQDVYLGKLRIVYTANNKTIAHNKLNALIGLFKNTKSVVNELKKKRLVWEMDLADAFKARVFEKGDIWTPSEIATLYHFPYKGTVVSNVVHTVSKKAPAPDILPRVGLVDPEEVSFIGETNYRNDKFKFGIKRIDRRRHLYIVGKTGSGKSRLLELLLISDIQSGKGCCLLDPHGDLAAELLLYVPKDRIKDVVYINPADRDFPIGFNPLEPVSDYETRQHLSRFFISIFKKLFAASWTPRMEHLVRFITLALLETPDSNILGIPRMLSDIQFRQRVIRQIQDPVVKSFWTNEFTASNQQFNTEAIIPILNKVGQFIANPIIRNMVGQQKNMINFDSFMDEGKIVIINVSKGKLGDENTALLGSMFITKIQQAALARAKIDEEKRRDFYFYVDEFQNFATDAFSTILSEARKYRLNLTMAHQYIAQLPDDVKATAFGNVGSLIVFAVGGDDAAYLSKEFSPVFLPDDMINLNIREMYVKMSIDGRVTEPFSAHTLSVPKSTFDYSIEILNNSRLLYGRNKTKVENEIAKWSQTTETMTNGESQFPEPII